MKTANSAAMAAEATVSTPPRRRTSADESAEQGYAPRTTEKEPRSVGDRGRRRPAYDDMYSGAAILDSTSTLHAVGVTGRKTTAAVLIAGQRCIGRIMETGIMVHDDTPWPSKPVTMSPRAAAAAHQADSCSPRPHGHGRGSAVVDNRASHHPKVQAALEARTCKGSKASLKAASQQRQLDRRRRLGGEGISRGRRGA